MNFNILGYILYLVIMVYIIAKIGQICYKNGIIYCNALLPNQEKNTKKVNEILLIGYYLVTIGYCFITLISWEQLSSFEDLIKETASKIAKILNY
jgi:hypothetical protein